MSSAHFADVASCTNCWICWILLNRFSELRMLQVSWGEHQWPSWKCANLMPFHPATHLHCDECQNPVKAWRGSRLIHGSPPCALLWKMMENGWNGFTWHHAAPSIVFQACSCRSQNLGTVVLRLRHPPGCVSRSLPWACSIVRRVWALKAGTAMLTLLWSIALASPLHLASK